ncbi:hypothetical protein MKZ38_008279 [Zalerion maritima]|uniref:Uncharacterized protein n=1 Tax=Zalerion maritima TaxID=339359 RepID=A0AAD5RHQ8_9PEZI|nr:hypothetical protein MKZ38_008279 [Zalerion maritima]
MGLASSGTAADEGNHGNTSAKDDGDEGTGDMDTEMEMDGQNGTQYSDSGRSKREGGRDGRKEGRKEGR